MIHAVAWAGVLWVTVLWLFHLIGLVASFRFRKRPINPDRDCANSRSQHEPLDTVQHVTILKPLLHVDDTVLNNLRTFMKLDYPKVCSCLGGPANDEQFDIVFCLPEGNPEDLRSLNKLIEDFPDVRARISTDFVVVGLNPKINNIC